MRPAARIALLIIGIAIAAYGTASLTGGWLGTPPWWEQPHPLGIISLDRIESGEVRLTKDDAFEPRPGRTAVSIGAATSGLALAAFGAWPRRRKEAHN